jgi:hypothetical protein
MDDLSWRTKTYFVGVTVQGTELVPRTELTFAPYSLGSPRATLADTAKVVKCSGAVGDVKYSMLNPTNFALANGSCWVPMDGRALATTDVLRQKYGITTLPNAGGLFLRGQEFDNSPNNDPDRTFNSLIAQFQDEGLKSHTHTGTTSRDPGHTHQYTDRYLANGSGSDPRYDANGSGNGYTNESTLQTSNSGAHEHTLNLSSTGSNETRPKNLNLWTYIRIN